MKPQVKMLAKRTDMHLLRKIWHVACGMAAISLYHVSNIELYYFGWIALGFAVVGFLLDFIRLNNEKFNNFALKVLGPIMRKSEVDGFSGLPFYALGAALTIFLYIPEIALLSILFLVIADPIASFIGVNYGKEKILPNKSLQGTVAGFFACYLITLVYISEMQIPSFNLLAFSILAGIVGAISELTSAFNIDDNLTIPVLSGAGLTVLNYIFHIF